METSFSKSKHVVMFVGSFDNLKRFKSRLLFSQGEEFTNALDIRPHKITVEPEPLVNLKWINNSFGGLALRDLSEKEIELHD